MNDQELIAEARRAGAELRRRPGDADRYYGALLAELADRLGVAVTEWGCRYDEEFVQRVHDEATARKIARAGKSLGHVPVFRKVTVGPWEVMPGEAG